MRFKIVEKKGFTVVGEKFFVKSESSSMVIPQLWEDMPAEDIEKLSGLSEDDGLMGVCGDMYNDGFDYWIAAVSEKKNSGLFEMYIPPLTWAVFEICGPVPIAIQRTWELIYSDWLPTSGYVHADAPEIEWYGKGDRNSVDYCSEIWIPVETWNGEDEASGENADEE